MALFGSKKTTETKAAAPKKTTAKTAVAKKVAPVAKSAPAVSASGVHTGAILRPRVTEKSGLQSQGGVYTFEVASNSNKNAIASAVKALYKVTPVKVAIINTPAKNVFVRGRRGVVQGVRKAMVTLKKGDKIDFV